MTDQAITKLEQELDRVLTLNGAYIPPQKVMLAIACELRALRLMLRDEIREAAWRLDDDEVPQIRQFAERPAPLASRKAPLEDAP